MRPSFLLLAPMLVSCAGSSPDAPAAPIDDAALTDTSPSEDDAAIDSAAPDTAPPDSAAPIDVGTDALAPDSGLEPKPPAGATLCASGTFAQGDAVKTCGEPSSVIDSVIGPDGKPKTVERHCDAVTVEGGRWEVWCSPKGIYFWTRIDGLRSTGAWVSCPASPHLELGMGLHDYAHAGGGGGGSLPGVIGKPNYFFSKTEATSVVASGTQDGAEVAKAGSLRVFVTAHHSATCSGTMVGPPDPDAVVTAVSMKWPKK